MGYLHCAISVSNICCGLSQVVTRPAALSSMASSMPLLRAGVSTTWKMSNDRSISTMLRAVLLRPSYCIVSVAMIMFFFLFV